MTDEQRKLLEQYDLRKDSELIALYVGGGLTETANETLRLALSERGIDPDTLEHVSEPTPLEDPMAPPYHIEPDVSQPEGLGGWLILVAGGMIVGLIANVYWLIDYIPLFTDGTWSMLTDPLSPDFLPNWGTLVIVEIGAYVGFIVFGIVLLKAFFQKLRVFPKLYIAMVVASLIFWSADNVVADRVMNNPASADSSSPIGLGTIIWVVYMFVSKRVKNTFVNPKDEVDQESTTSEDERPLDSYA